jgi:hypothetical protein
VTSERGKDASVENVFLHPRLLPTKVFRTDVIHSTMPVGKTMSKSWRREDISLIFSARGYIILRHYVTGV